MNIRKKCNLILVKRVKNNDEKGDEQDRKYFSQKTYQN